MFSCKGNNLDLCSKSLFVFLYFRKIIRVSMRFSNISRMNLSPVIEHVFVRWKKWHEKAFRKIFIFVLFRLLLFNINEYLWKENSIELDFVFNCAWRARERERLSISDLWDCTQVNCWFDSFIIVDVNWSIVSEYELEEKGQSIRREKEKRTVNSNWKCHRFRFVLDSSFLSIAYAVYNTRYDANLGQAMVSYRSSRIYRWSTSFVDS